MSESFFARKKDLIIQFSRFAGIGFLNTAVDFAAINILIAATGITSGGRLAIANAAAFALAVIHSYYWNKFWAFSQQQSTTASFLRQVISAGLLGIIVIAASVYGAGKGMPWAYHAVLLGLLAIGEVILWIAFRLKSLQARGTEFSLFMIVSVIGIVINSAVVGLVTGLFSPPLGVSPELWANFAKVLATAVALIWNFIGYKFFVFKR